MVGGGIWRRAGDRNAAREQDVDGNSRDTENVLMVCGSRGSGGMDGGG